MDGIIKIPINDYIRVQHFVIVEIAFYRNRVPLQVVLMFAFDGYMPTMNN